MVPDCVDKNMQQPTSCVTWGSADHSTSTETKEPEGTETDILTQTALTTFVSQVTQLKRNRYKNIFYFTAWYQQDKSLIHMYSMCVGFHNSLFCPMAPVSRETEAFVNAWAG